MAAEARPCGLSLMDVRMRVHRWQAILKAMRAEVDTSSARGRHMAVRIERLQGELNELDWDIELDLLAGDDLVSIGELE